MTSKRYALVKTLKGQRFIEIQREAEDQIVGLRVNEYGSLWDPNTGKKIKNELVTVHPSDVLGYYRFNHTYGTLVYTV